MGLSAVRTGREEGASAARETRSLSSSARSKNIPMAGARHSDDGVPPAKPERAGSGQPGTRGAVCVFFGRSGGKSERQARELCAALRGRGVEAVLVQTAPRLAVVAEDAGAGEGDAHAAVSIGALLDEHKAGTALFCVPTYGHGALPGGLAGLEHVPRERLARLAYAVCAFGTSRFPPSVFCAAGKRVEAHMRACGARPLAPLFLRDDVSTDGSALREWVSTVVSKAAGEREQGVRVDFPASARPEFTVVKRDSFLAKQRVETETETGTEIKAKTGTGTGTGTTSTITTKFAASLPAEYTVSSAKALGGGLHLLTVQLRGEAVPVGSDLLVTPSVPRATVEEALGLYRGAPHGADEGDVLVSSHPALPAEITLGEYFSWYLDLHSPPSAALWRYVEDRLGASSGVVASLRGRAGVRAIDCLKACAGCLPTLGELAVLVRGIEPRAYSLAPCGGGRAEVLVRRLTLPDGVTAGLCSGQLAAARCGTRIRACVQQPSRAVDVREARVLVGLGTGIAPIRTVLRGRMSDMASGRRGKTLDGKSSVETRKGADDNKADYASKSLERTDDKKEDSDSNSFEKADDKGKASANKSIEQVGGKKERHGNETVQSDGENERTKVFVVCHTTSALAFRDELCDVVRRGARLVVSDHDGRHSGEQGLRALGFGEETVKALAAARAARAARQHTGDGRRCDWLDIHVCIGRAAFWSELREARAFVQRAASVSKAKERPGICWCSSGTVDAVATLAKAGINDVPSSAVFVF